MSRDSLELSIVKCQSSQRSDHRVYTRSCCSTQRGARMVPGPRAPWGRYRNVIAMDGAHGRHSLLLVVTRPVRRFNHCALTLTKLTKHMYRGASRTHKDSQGHAQSTMTCDLRLTCGLCEPHCRLPPASPCHLLAAVPATRISQTSCGTAAPTVAPTAAKGNAS